MKRIFFPFICVLMLSAFLLLPGCTRRPPVTFSSVLTIEADESGCRTMTVTANKNTLQSLFGSRTFSFQSFISANCPESVEWSYVETAVEYQMTFRLPFDSLEEYQELSAAITGTADFTTVSRPQVGVKTGFTLTERDELLAFFTWFTDAMKERTGMSAAQLAPSLTVLSNELVFNERSYPKSDGKLCCTAETFLDAQRIDILTKQSLNGWQRRVMIVFPAELMANASNVKKYLGSLLPENMEASWEGNTTWCLDFSASDFTELGLIMRGLFQSTDDTSCSEAAAAENSMRIVHAYREPVNFSFFVPNTGVTHARYFVSTDTQASISSSGSGSTKPFTDSAYPDYQCIFDGEVEKSICYEYDAVFQYQPREILITTRVNSIQLFDRSFEMFLGEVPLQHQKLIYDTLCGDASGFGIVSQSNDESGYRLTFSQVGTPRYLSQGFSRVFHGTEALDYASSNTDLFRSSHLYRFTQQQDFTAFLASPEATSIRCRISFPSAISIQEDALAANLEQQTIADNTYDARSTSGSVRIDMSLSLANPAYYLCLIAMLAMVSGILYGIYEWLVLRR